MSKDVHILLVEDDVGEVKAFQRALMILKIVNPLTVASDMDAVRMLEHYWRVVEFP